MVRELLYVGGMSDEDAERRLREQLVQARLGCGLSQRELAALVNTSPTTIHWLEHRTELIHKLVRPIAEVTHKRLVVGLLSTASTYDDALAEIVTSDHVARTNAMRIAQLVAGLTKEQQLRVLGYIDSVRSEPTQ